ncbi:MAG TPA: WecB/TagA/CpsF family glycosyltransferase [Candidatus Limnocylindrales bacterium]|nr:WecB/TagA/CpsF family glycosyltransferase [Candidatus Limnocylindrales bacterium]
MRPPIQMMGVPMHPWTMKETVEEIARRLDAGLFTQHAVVNVAKMVNIQRDPALRNAVLRCDIINIDGMGVVWGAWLLGLDVPERVAGIDLFYRLLALAEEREDPVFFLGAESEVVIRAVERAQKIYPRLIIAGYHHGYFWDNEEEVVRKIRESGARMLFVAITSPKKEQFIARWQKQLGVGFAMGVGGAFDIMAGKTKRAPNWMQKMGLEWFYRIVQEPQRMWKRYLVTNSLFVWMLLREKLGKRNKV